MLMCEPPERSWSESPPWPWPCAAAYLAGILVLATGDAVGNVLEGDRYAMAAFLVGIGGAVFAGAGAVAWFARRDQHS